jgi:2-amino-4-hydroxy-6-hydroxymethyldihydropteridine diphosphokinase
VTRAVLSVGSNLGDRFEYLRMAVDGLGDTIRALSPVYETAPWGVTDQADFLNQILIVEDDRTDEWGWLRRAKELERAADRVRTQHWGPRTLDVDVIMVDDVTSDDPELRLPHPRAHERAFVLVPLRDVWPDARIPGRGRVADLIDALGQGEIDGVRRWEKP